MFNINKFYEINFTKLKALRQLKDNLCRIKFVH